MTKGNRTTVVDIARSARVAVGTVSRVLNNHADVNCDIRARVLQAAHNLNYTRIRQRRVRREPAPSREGLGHIAVICFGMEDTLVQLPVVSSALQGIESTLSHHGRSLLLANIPKGDRVPPFLLEDRVEGLILKGPNQGSLPSPEHSDLLRHIYRFPHVWLMGRPPNARGDHCNFDTEAAGRLAAEYLRANGHQRIAFLNPKPGQNQFERLKDAFFATAAREGCQAVLLETPPPEKLQWPLPAITLQDNVNLLLGRWLAEPVERRATAIFVPSDRTAAQLYAALARLGLHAGTDVSVVSCNNEEPVHADLQPALSTIDVHAEAVGRRAVEQLLWRLSHPHDAVAEQVLIEPALVARASVVNLAAPVCPAPVAPVSA
jgi:DNA-binding LacI/PurR family transcriptional regulator